mmetsp:Transcript_159401/g.511422  ORF Transcript_159401/g.511422 Transcript_159401/m.511422 type:complete len:264 (+) Transcript_159401:130-921(+)
MKDNGLEGHDRDVARYGHVLETQLLEPIVALQARASENLFLATETIVAFQLIDGECLERVTDEGDFFEGRENSRDRVLVQQEPRKHQEEDHACRRHLRSHFHTANRCRDDHAQPDAGHVLDRDDGEVHEHMAESRSQTSHGINNCAEDAPGQRFKRQLRQHRRKVERQHAVEFGCSVALHDLQLPRDYARGADHTRESLVHGDKEENAGSVLERLLRHVHAEVHRAEDQREEQLHDHFEGKCHDIPHDFSPCPPEQQLKLHVW